MADRGAAAKEVLVRAALVLAVLAKAVAEVRETAEQVMEAAEVRGEVAKERAAAEEMGLAAMAGRGWEARAAPVMVAWGVPVTAAERVGWAAAAGSVLR